MQSSLPGTKLHLFQGTGNDEEESFKSPCEAAARSPSAGLCFCREDPGTLCKKGQFLHDVHR